MDFHNRGHWLDAFNSVLGVMALKQPKKLQRWMKELLAKKKLNPNNWYYVKNTPGELVIIHRYSGKPRIIPIEKGE
jgi:hypothetical protein